MKRPTHRVTCKIAFYNPDKTKILITEYHSGGMGLPGGHLEFNELPKEAILRELKEELNLNYTGRLERNDFWIHENGKVILGFTGELDESQEFTIDEKELKQIIWVDIDDIRKGKITAGSYDEFILKPTS